MNWGRLLLITNLEHDDRHEDLCLAERLAECFDVSVVSPIAAVPLLAAGAAEGCLIRNAWPGRAFKDAFAAIETLTSMHRIGTYNPLIQGRRGPVENKTYLIDLFQAGHPVIPSYASTEAMEQAGFARLHPTLSKPIDGCSSVGIVETSLEKAPGGAFIHQPKIVFDHEVSLYFIDNHYAWAMQSRGPAMDDRWHLSPYDPTEMEIRWAAEFVRWNRLPYGIQRIDAAKMNDGRLLLMEIEDSTPLLSLSDLTETKREAVLKALVESVMQRLGVERPSVLAQRRQHQDVAKWVDAIHAA